jgi:hypothetical protein
VRRLAADKRIAELPCRSELHSRRDGLITWQTGDAGLLDGGVKSIRLVFLVLCRGREQDSQGQGRNA